MRRTLLYLFTLVFISVALLGCQSENKEERLLEGNITKVSLSKSEGFGQLNSDFIVVFKDEQALETFRRVLSNAVQEEAIVDMVKPAFDLEIIYENQNKQGFHLWIGKKGQKSTLMKTNNTHTIYTISAEMTNRLIDLVQ